MPTVLIELNNFILEFLNFFKVEVLCIKSKFIRAQLVIKNNRNKKSYCCQLIKVFKCFSYSNINHGNLQQRKLEQLALQIVHPVCMRIILILLVYSVYTAADCSTQ